MPINRTDLAMECFENVDGGTIPGAQVSHWESGGIEITDALRTAAREMIEEGRGYR